MWRINAIKGYLQRGWNIPFVWTVELFKKYEELQAQNEALREQIEDQAAKIRRLGEVSSNWRMAYHDSAQLASALLKIPAHDTVAEQWRNAYVQVADAYRALLAKTPEAYLVNGHDAQYWAKNAASWRQATDVANLEFSQKQRALDDLSTKYLVLRAQNAALNVQGDGLLKALLDDRAKYSRLKRAAADAADDLNEILDANG